MHTFHPQYIKDATGNNALVVLLVKEFEQLLEELEDLEDVRAYDAAKAADTGERVPIKEAFAAIEARRKEREA